MTGGWPEASLIADIAAKHENDWRVNIRKLGQTHSVSAKTVQAALQKELNPLQDVIQVGAWTAEWRDEKEEIVDMRGFMAMVCHHSLTMLDNIVTASGLVGCRENCQSHPNPGDLQERVGGGWGKSHGSRLSHGLWRW
jgi:hypothetical protein